MSISKIEELEITLELLKENNNNNGFPLSNEQKQVNVKKATYLDNNKEIIFSFLRWLNRYGIDLKITSFKERGILFTIFNKEENCFKRKQQERDVLQEVMSRCL